MHKLGSAAIAGVLTIGAAAVALAAGAAPSIIVHPKVTPAKAGTSAHPQGVSLHVTVNWQTLGAANQPIVQSFKLMFPRGSLYQGAKYPSCSYARLNALGPSGCPAASIVGHGTGSAYADTVITHPTITVVNGGAKTVYFYTVLNNPATVQAPVVGHISRVTGKYAYSLVASIPSSLQVVAGVPIELTSLTVSAKHAAWLSTTGCPHGGWPFSVTTSYSTGTSASYSSKVRCHK